MRVKDVMMGSPISCRPETNLAEAVEMLWSRNCGMLPVVNAQGQIAGVITDRDMCIALGTRNRLPSEITVKEVSNGKVKTCKADDDIHAALEIMAAERIRRLPVVNAAGKLEGILSMDDVALHAQGQGDGASELSYADLGSTLKKVYRPQLPEVAQKQAAGRQ